MTQMMLFDTATLAAPVAAASPATSSKATSSKAIPSTGELGLAESQSAPGRPAMEDVSRAANRSPIQGGENIHRMGDLARLVLLRYQLVAKRRQELQGANR